MTEMTKTPNPQQIAVCVFRTHDAPTDCERCARVKVDKVPKDKQAWQYVPKVGEDETCPSLIGIK